MTPDDLARLLDQLEHRSPQRRQSRKRAQLNDVRERLLRLHARGHSWRAIARELSATGEKVTADLLRAVCKAHPKRRRPERNALTAVAAESRVTKPAPRVVPPATGTATFGAKGLQL